MSNAVRRMEKPSWLTHSMAPVEPYVPQHGGERPAPQPDNVTRPVHARRGYYRDLDWTDPRTAPQPKPSLRNARKVDVLSKPDPSAQYSAGESGLFACGYSSRSVTYPQKYGQGKDNKWEPIEKLPEVFKDEIESRRQYRTIILEDAEVRSRRKQHEKDLEAKIPEGTDIARTRTKNQKPHYKRTYLDTMMRRFEKAMPALDVSGAPKKDYLETNNKERSRNARGYMQDPLEREKAEAFKRDLDVQIQEQRNQRELQRRESEQAILLNDGFSGLGREVNELWNETKERKARARKPRTREKPIDRQLAQDLKSQTEEQKALRKQEKENAKTSVAGYSPWGNYIYSPTKKYNRQAPITGMKEPDPEPVEGVSLVNTKSFGTRGGGAPSYIDGDRRILDGSRKLHATEAAAESEARAAGKSPFGHPGAGAPVLNEDGSINTRTKGYIATDFSRKNNEGRPMQSTAGQLRKKGDLATGKGEFRPMLPKDGTALQSQIQEKMHRHEQEKAQERQLEYQSANMKDFSEVNKERVAQKMRNPRRPRDSMLHMGEVAQTGVINRDPTVRKAIADDLEARIAQRASQKNANRERRRREEAQHAEAASKMFAPQRDKEVPRREFDPLQYEHRLLVKKRDQLS